MRITGTEQLEIASHVGRKLASMETSDTNLKVQICRDIYSQLHREFGLEKMSELDDKYLYEAHEKIDCYELPLYLWEKVEAEKAKQ